MCDQHNDSHIRSGFLSLPEMENNEKGEGHAKYQLEVVNHRVFELTKDSSSWADK